MSEFFGVADPTETQGEFNALVFLIRQIVNEVSTATLVKVLWCTNSGGLSPVGFVNVQPLVNQLTGSRNPVPDAPIYQVPYMRLQGGTNAVILDPQIGDIGICLFADHDISSVIANKAQANPGSYRRFDMADGLYIGGVLNGVPAQYVQFSSSGISIVSPTQITLTAPIIDINGTTNIDGPVNQSGGTLSAATEVTAPQVTASTDVSVAGLSVKDHTHPYSPGSGATTETGSMQG